MRQRRSLAAAALVASFAALAGASCTSDPAPVQGVVPTIVIVHGAWGGAWDWQETADTLEAWGYPTHRVTLTGLGERSHLLTPEVDLSTHVTDAANVLQWEQLRDVVLVGHSYGGMVITGVAERVPERLRHLVYFDAFLPFDGECAFAVGREADAGDPCTLLSAAEMAGGTLLNDAIPAGWVEADAGIPRDVPHPAGTLVERIDLAGPPGNGVPAGYIVTREAPGAEDSFDVPAARAAELGWPVMEYIGDHVPYRQDPAGVARAFLQAAGLTAPER